MLCQIVLFLVIVIVPKLVAGQGGPALREFTDDLTSQLYDSSSPNHCTSVWGVSMLFDLLRPGTDDATAVEQMCDVVGLCGEDDDSNTDQLLWEDAVARLEAEYDGSCEDEDENECQPLLRVANSVWVDDTSELAQSYEEVVGELVHQTDFSQEDAVDEVNNWVNQSTLGLIDNIFERGAIQPGDLAAVNTIYLKAAWTFGFQEDMTSSEVFHVDESTTGETHFMHLAMDPYYGGFKYSHSALEGYQILKLIFHRSTLSMAFVLPLLDDSTTWNQEEDTEKLKNQPSNDVRAALGNLEWDNKVAVAIPKFKFESEYEEVLETALKSLGLMAPFDPVFCGMLINLCMSIDTIAQKTLIDVNENGVEAAAATGAILVISLPPPETVPAALFKADRPFKFFIYDESEDVFLFEGFVTEPNIPEGSSAPLEDSHNDEGFWTKNFDFAFTPEQPTKPGNMTVPPNTTVPPTPPVREDNSLSPCGSNLLLIILQILLGWTIGWLFGFGFCEI